MAAAIRSGNLDLGDFVTMLDASEETVLTAADASMSLGDRMAILQHKAEKALEPVGNLLIGAFEDAMPFLEGAGTISLTSDRGSLTGRYRLRQPPRRSLQPSGPDGARSGVL